MPYCVHCGVELMPTEKACPLCGVPVCDPAGLADGGGNQTFPERRETLRSDFDIRSIAYLAGILLLIPLTICLLCDLLDGGGLTWSRYVIYSICLLYTVVFVPFLVRKKRVLICSLLDVAAVLVYLLLLERLSGYVWFVSLGLPLAFASYLMLATCALFIFGGKRRGPKTVRAAYVLFTLGLYTACVDWIIRAYSGFSYIVGWSVYTLVPCVFLGFLLLVLNGDKALKERIHRWFFL